MKIRPAPALTGPDRNGIMPDDPEWTTSARPSFVTSIASRPVLDRLLLMKPFVPKDSVFAGKMKAFGRMKKPPSGFNTFTATAPLPFAGTAGAEGNVNFPPSTKFVDVELSPGPGLKISIAPGWKFAPSAL